MYAILLCMVELCPTIFNITFRSFASVGEYIYLSSPYGQYWNGDLQNLI